MPKSCKNPLELYEDPGFWAFQVRSHMKLVKLCLCFVALTVWVEVTVTVQRSRFWKFRVHASLMLCGCLVENRADNG